jgi:hypothetical protein
MPKNEKQISPTDGGIFRDIANQIKLIVRLVGDQRVSPLLKLLPFGSLIYLVFPDLAPGPIDDALVIGLGTYIFVELCPPDVVQEHKEALQSVIPGKWKEAVEEEISEEDIVDAEYTEK